ncbi:MATE family efflux transporter [Halobellus clavatus]|jgi:putative MATE family efflux protein|uniref:Putative efflux protein, MATE family n=1 Tax=Halobellus clavatus TaxID=660517 RepID=A0A1H3FKS6_9EURY|nr:MATE family efflux transporter [Halobellus clavatus]SDX91703.1 putative efflux protein, MATE family [Halobellus clavatus]
MSLLDRLGSVFKGPEELNLTGGGIGRPLFYLSLPIVITNLLQTAYNLADTFWLGQYSTEALAAISFGFPMVFLLISLGMGISIAGSVLVAQHIGADEEAEAEYAASQTVSFATIGSIILGSIGFIAVGPFIEFLGASPEVLPLATNYMQVIAAGLPFMFGFFVFIALMRGYGDTVTPMLVMFGSVVLNIAIDPFLIFGFEGNPLFSMLGLGGLEATLLTLTGYTGSGITGAAIATIFSRALAFVVGIAIMFQGIRGVRIRPSQMRPNFQYLRKLLEIGAPASVEVTGRALSVNLLLLVVGLFPTPVVAAFGIGTRVFSVIFLPAIAVARGVETMTGQNIGAQKPERAGMAADFAAKWTLIILSAVGALTLFFPRTIIAIFTNDPEVITVGADFLRLVAPTFGFIGVMRAYSGSFRGAGKTLIAAAISVIMLGLIRIPVAYVASQSYGSTGIWLAFPISNVAGALIAYTWYRRGTWRTGSVRGPTPADD